jgi:hypothetical protein
MTRLQQSRRHFGLSQDPKKYQQTGNGLVLAGNGLVLAGGSGCGHGQKCGCSQCGAGLMDSIRSGLVKGRDLGIRASDIITGEFGTAVRNLIPSSDAGARPQYPGEKHAILKLPNGKYGMANFMGPGTELEKRLMRGDPPRTMVDRVAMAHDSRYALAKTQAEVAAADRKMIAKLQDMKARKQDSRFNIELGLRPIQAKLRAEQFGLVAPGKIASFGDVSNRALVENNLKMLEQEGFGNLPGQMLKRQLLETVNKPVRKSPNLNKTKVVDFMSKLITGKLLPILLKKMQSASGLKLAGQGGNGMCKSLNTKLRLRMGKAMSKCSNKGKCLPGTSRPMQGKGIIPTRQQLKQMALDATKTILPIIIKMALAKAGLNQTGSGVFVNRAGETIFKPSTFDKLVKPLNDSILKALRMGLQSLSGKGMSGEGFFDDFGKGFMSVWDPIIKVGKTAAPFIPLLL